MKLIYIANVRMPTEKAHGIQIMKMCEAFADAGLELDLIVPARFNKIKQNAFNYYGVKRIFKIKKLPVIDFIWFNFPFAFFLETVIFTISVFFYLIFQRNYILYTRGEMILGLKPFLKSPLAPLFKRGGGGIFWETHIKPKKFKSYQAILKTISGLVVVTKYYKKELIEKYGAPAEKILCLPDGVDLNKFDVEITKEEARKKLELPLNKKIVLYAGSLIPWKGADIFLEASRLLPLDFLIIIAAGGEKEDIERFKKSINNLSINNLLLLEHRPHEKIPYYLKAADILILTGAKESEISLYYTSPLKLFEYMASKRPILAADMPSFQEILNEDSAFFYQSDDAGDFVRQINFIFENYSLAEEKTGRALAKVKEFTWQKRAERILKFIQVKL